MVGMVGMVGMVVGMVVVLSLTTAQMMWTAWPKLSKTLLMMKLSQHMRSQCPVVFAREAFLRYVIFWLRRMGRSSTAAHWMQSLLACRICSASSSMFTLWSRLHPVGVVGFLPMD
jgi:hypothetical protein